MDKAKTKPNVPIVGNNSNIPNVPNVPIVTNTPNVPIVPNIPNVPIVPNIPNVPIVPNIPNVPIVPNIPMTPYALVPPPGPLNLPAHSFLSGITVQEFIVAKLNSAVDPKDISFWSYLANENTAILHLGMQTYNPIVRQHLDLKIQNLTRILHTLFGVA